MAVPPGWRKPFRLRFFRTWGYLWFPTVTIRRTFTTLIFIASTASPLPARDVDFGRDVQPLLSDACYHCHGPDEKARKAELRLDTKDGIFRTKDGITVVKPGSPSESDLADRVSSIDPDEQMPPPKANRKLKPEEIDLLKRWIAEGAKWGQPWAFTPPRAATSAPPVQGGWGHNEIDAFVAARLALEGLTLSPEADKARLLRRVALDLTGLPPSLEDLNAFLRDPSPGAYDAVVERLLASPRFGERMAADWMDIARFADTHGYQADRERAMWPWRDWAIAAFNRNMPYDQFGTWQLAGDLLPDATKEQRLATAFNRLHNQNEEGGIVGEEYRVAYVVDRVNTFGTAFLGLTFECCRCHDHKFDPISQRDYYSLFSFFQNIDEAGQISYGGFSDVMPVPTMLLSTPEQDKQLADLRQKTADAEKALAQSRAPSGAAFDDWLAHKGPAPASPQGLAARFTFDSFDGGKVANTADPSKPGHLQGSPKLIAGKLGMAAELDGDNGFTFPGLGVFKRTDAFSLSLWVEPTEESPRMTVLHHSKAPVDAASRGYELLLENGHAAFGMHYIWPAASLKVVTKKQVALNDWTQVTVTYDGSSRAGGIHIYLNGEDADLEVVRDGLYKDITYVNGEPDLAIGFRFRDNGFKGGRVDDLNLFNRALTPLEASSMAGKSDLNDAWNSDPAKLAPSQRNSLADYFGALVDANAIEASKRVRGLREEQNRLVNGIPEIMVMEELKQPKPAFILKRGAYDAHGDEVHADTPHALAPFPATAPRNRLGLAQWLFAPENPLAARVAVNRLWQMMFGRGLVETSDNFGSQGAPPTHPELLDWLASDFVANKWDVKATLKKIAISAAYRQSSKASPDLLARDPQNILLARGPARRLTAEMLRDQALADSGLLVEKLGGPSVKPYQPAGLWEEIAMGRPHYDQGHGDDLHRRSLYTFWKRTVPPPVMITFDAAERNICTVRRQSTSTPLQALAMLNDVQIVEAARKIAERMLKQGGGLDTEIEWLFQLLADRKPSQKETAVLRQLYLEQRDLFAADPKSAEKLLAFGEAKPDPTLPPLDLAAGTILAKSMLNFDECLMRR